MSQAQAHTIIKYCPTRKYLVSLNLKGNLQLMQSKLPAHFNITLIITFFTIPNTKEQEWESIKDQTWGEKLQGQAQAIITMIKNQDQEDSSKYNYYMQDW